MITTTDSANILYQVCQAFGVPVYQGENIPNGEIEPQGRVVIHAKEQTSETYWKKNFIEVNLFAKDTERGNANLIRLNELEREAQRVLKGVGVYDDTTYRLTLYSTSIMDNSDLRAHYVNARVLFQTINLI